MTRGKLTLRFDDKNGVLEIRTPKHLVKLDDKAGEVRVEDGNRNRVTLSKSGIALESASNLTISAKGNVTIDAKGNLAMKAGGNATLEGIQVASKAKLKYSAASGGFTEIKASGLVKKVQGAIVKIN